MIPTTNWHGQKPLAGERRPSGHTDPACEVSCSVWCAPMLFWPTTRWSIVNPSSPQPIILRREWCIICRFAALCSCMLIVLSGPAMYHQCLTVLASLASFCPCRHRDYNRLVPGIAVSLTFDVELLRVHDCHLFCERLQAIGSCSARCD